ncbi:MAG: 4-hydroxy-tetrahydrodipicolinate reductase [Dehalococcoidia bacterium]|nr:4-hydroxy-tetrahydrodipicolinate reductase [Dehalococcoidia bacterium]
MIRVAVSGTGNMGATVIAALEAQSDLQLVGVIAPRGAAGKHRAAGGALYRLQPDPAALFAATRPDVVVDFTNAAFVPQIVAAALAAGVRPVIGTSGIAAETVEALRAGCERRRLGALVAPNFAIGAVVLMHLAQIAARYFDAAEIIELHHDRKVDAPSGTAIETARLMRAARGSDFDHPQPRITPVEGSRGGVLGGVGLHSVRLPGLVAHQEVILGGPGQTLTLRHDSIGRDSFMPGVLLAIRAVMERENLTVGLGELIGLR